MFGWRRRGKGCWTVTKGREYWYPVKVRIVGRKLWRFRLFELIGLENLHGVPWLRLCKTLRGARKLARRMNRRRGL